MSTISGQKQRLAELLDPTVPVERRSRPTRKIPPPGVEVETKLLDGAEPTSTATGEFVAKVSDYGTDRQRERFARHAFDSAIAMLRADARALPVLYGHDQNSTTAIIGHVPPEGWEANDAGLFARGWIDTATDVGRHVHRMLRKGALSWSIGFTIKRARPSNDGVRVLEQVGELLELSVVPVPANSAPTLALKGSRLQLDPDPPSHEEQVERARALGVRTPMDEQACNEFYDGMLGCSPKRTPSATRSRTAMTRHRATSISNCGYFARATSPGRQGWRTCHRLRSEPVPTATATATTTSTRKRSAPPCRMESALRASRSPR